MKAALLPLVGFIAIGLARAAEPAPLALEYTIALGTVQGRIDHLTVDLRRRRLYVAELGNDSVGVVDLEGRVSLPALTQLDEPQGVLFVAATDELYVANGGDGSIRVFKGEDLAPVTKIELGNDADNLRLAPMAGHVLAGYGSGGLAVIDFTAHRLVVRIPLRGHPEGFQLSRDGQRAFVNVPGNHEIAVVELGTRQALASWPTAGTGANYPMALEPDGTGLWTVFRNPPRLARFDSKRGAATLSFESCDDADDLFIDNQRHRLYVICGSGYLDVWQQRGAQYERIARIATAPGARTSLFVPELDRLYIARRSSSGQPAAILVFRPGPD